MESNVSASFEIKDWNETTYSEYGDSRKLTRVRAKTKYEGGIMGEGELECLMSYDNTGNAIFVGLERIEASISDRTGTFVFQHVGTFEKGIVKSIWNVGKDSGSHGFEGLNGTCKFESGHAESYEIECEFQFECAP